ncbi:MAG: hypothetical protein NC040_08480 [Muribaculaceae bacterium]|nr:hypothetical protein [Alistipes senegalensis]MCM1474082.1 hypothetical protein [Muribaculaceae bacterium]
MSKKNEQNNKKGNAFAIIAVILLIIAIALILIGLFGGLGFGNGSGNGTEIGTGSGNTSSIENSVSENSESPANILESSESAETETTTEKTEPEVNYIDVTVSGSSYLMNGKETTLDEITQSAGNKNTIVRITDDNAIADSMDALVSALDGAEISHVSQN